MVLLAVFALNVAHPGPFFGDASPKTSWTPSGGTAIGGPISVEVEAREMDKERP